MQNITPARPTPKATHAQAAQALERLVQSAGFLSAELQQLPTAGQSLLDSMDTPDTSLINLKMADLLQEIDTWWRAPSASGQYRREAFTACLKAAFKDEIILKCHEDELTPAAAQYFSADDTARNDPALTAPPLACSLHVMLQAQSSIEIRGALVMTPPAGPTLLMLPGLGLCEFPTQQIMLNTLVEWLNDDALRGALLVNADQRHQDAVFAVINDPALDLEPFQPQDVYLHTIIGDPYRHALQSQIEKQREDVIHACTGNKSAPAELRARRIASAVRMAGLFGPEAMLARREQLQAERTLRTRLPDWIKLASPEDLSSWLAQVERYDQAREALSSALNGAASADQYAQISVRTRLANDLGYDLAPARVTITTQRALPITGEPYTVTRTLPDLALYGLHPGDSEAGSSFLTQTSLYIDGEASGAAHAALTPAYVARMIDELQLRARFGDHQRAAYENAGHQMLMRQLLDLQITEAAQAASMQGHIGAEDLALIKTLQAAPDADNAALHVLHLKINGSGTPGQILLFRKLDAQGALERLVMFTANAPGDRRFYSFTREIQLLEELITWATRPEMRRYLLEQLPTTLRPEVLATFEALDLKPDPAPHFVQLELLNSYHTALHTLVDLHVQATLSNLRAHTPDWWTSASAPERQRLIALEDAAEGAIRNYNAKAHTRVQAFEDYVHARASEKICHLLNVPLGTVDPDTIIITTERETLSYTRMMRNGYDDSIGFLNPTADTVATFSGPAGVDLSALTPATVAGSVRGKWLADEYIARVRSTLLDPQSPGYEYRRRTQTVMTRLHMQSAALRSLLKGHIDAAQYQWLETIITKAHRSDAETRAHCPIYPLQIHIDKPFIASRLHLIDQWVIPNTPLTHIETVQGCFALLPTDTRHSALLYTPKAPDGIEFRLFSSFVESLGHSGMIDYYKDRCRIKARRVLSFFLNDMKHGNANKAPSLPKAPIADFAQVCFNRPIERKLRDVEETTTGRSDMLGRLVWTMTDIVATVLTLPFPPASFAVGVALSLRDGLHALRALTGESPEDADALILASLLNMAGAAGDFSQGVKGFGGVLRKLAKDSAPSTHPAALDPTVASASRGALYPVKLRDEAFLMGKPNANGQARVFQNAAFEPDDVYPTGHYAARDNHGTWQPLEQSRPDANRTVNISLDGLPRATEGHATGVSIGQGKCYIRMGSEVYQVHYDASVHCWHIVDPDNPFAFFGRQPVRLNDQGEWTRIHRTGLRGGGDSDNATAIAYRPLPDGGSADEPIRAGLAAYELPTNLQPHLDEILMGTSLDPMGFGLEAFFAERYALIRETYNTLRENLYRDARAFFSTPVEMPPRPTLPTVDASTTFNGFLESAFSQSNGLVLSEVTTSITSKKFLMNNMQALVDQRVEVLYLPHVFTDGHSRKLAKYFAKGSRVRTGSHEIKYHLKYLNDRALDNLSREYDYYHLIKQAHRHGIEVRPLSSSVSYPVEAHPVISAATDNSSGQKMSNFFGHTLISSEVAESPTKRWVALVDHRMATTHHDIPGLAQLQGSISVQISDVPTGRVTHIHRNAELIDSDFHSTACDFRIDVADPAAMESAVIRDIPVNAIDPSPGHSASTLQTARQRSSAENGFSWDESEGWRRVASEQWLAENPPTAVQQSLVDGIYDMPRETREAMFQLAYAKRKGLDSEYFFFGDELSAVQDQFFALRLKLREDARRITTADLPPRPAMPALEPPPGHAEFIQRLYQQTDGLVIGEYHASVGSKQFLIDNMPLLARQNVKTLYMEHLLTDLHQADLDRFFETGHMTERLLRSLRFLDNGHLTDRAKVYTFEQLVIKARHHGLEVRALDCAASYHLKGLQKTSTTRQEMMNYFASRTIRRHQAVMGKHKWVALVGNSHANDYHGVPGLAELEGAIGVRFDDVAPGSSRGITIDAGEELRRSMSTQTAFIKSDFMIEMETAGRSATMRAPQPLPLEERLSRPGMFLTEHPSGNLYFIAHRSRDNVIHRTPIQISPEGQVFVDRPSWGTVHLQRYNDIDELIRALEDINLTRVG